MKRLGTLAILGMATHSGFAQTHQDGKTAAAHIDALVEAQLDKGLLGVAVAVVKKGKVLHQMQYTRRPITGRHYRMASITKMFTAAAVVKLVRDKKLAYEDTLGKLMPEVPAEWHPVTLRQLLTHTSGIPSYTDIPSFMAISKEPAPPDRIWQFAAKSKPDFAPGEGWNYNNTAYCLVGSIVERITKRDFYTALDRLVLKPSGMRETGPETRFKPVPSFDEQGQPSFPLNMDWPYSAGALVTTVGDLIKWDAALRGTKVFTKAEKDLMRSPDPTALKFGQAYGFGWATHVVNDKPFSWGHTGGIPGFSTSIEQTVNGVTVIVLANHEHPSRALLAAQIREAFDPAPEQMAIADDNPALTTKLRQVFEELLRGEVRVAAFEPEFLKAVTVEGLKQTMAALGSSGGLKDFMLIGGGEARRTYLVKLEQRNVRLTLTIKGGLIADMLLRPA